jgi:acetyl-CoA decarbonylase/synthase complex subunit gamma
LKGLILGLLIVLGGSQCFSLSKIDLVANMLLMAPVCAFLTLNFTGSTTFTSLSGVQKEMLYAIPAMAVSFLAGMGVKIFA